MPSGDGGFTAGRMEHMSLDWESINKRRISYIDKRNLENEKIALKSGLTASQIEAVEEICRIRHEIHTTDERNIVSENDCISELINKIWNLVDDNDLPAINLHMYEEDWVTDCDWYNIYTDAERQEWYNKANGSEDGGRNLWYDYACGICAELISKINGEIES